jgi:hypothetical protein
VSNPKLAQAIELMKKRNAELELATLQLKDANDRRFREQAERDRAARLEPLPLRQWPAGKR